MKRLLPDTRPFGQQMLRGMVGLLLILTLLASATSAPAIESASLGTKCADSSATLQDGGGVCAEPADNLYGEVPEGVLPLLIMLRHRALDRQRHPQATTATPLSPAEAPAKVIVYFFWGNGCPHCEEERQFLAELQRSQPALEIREYEVWNNRQNAGLLGLMLRARGVRSSGVPVTFVHDQLFSGFTAQTRGTIEQAITECTQVACGDPGQGLASGSHTERSADSPPPVSNKTSDGGAGTGAASSVTIPFLGPLDTQNSSLPMLTLIIAGMDSFNPCAFFVLLSLLGLLVHAQSRNKMLLVGGIFVFFSGFIYFLFMAAWLNLFLVMGRVALITTFAGCVSLVIAVINIKDFFLFKQGVSLTIPDSAKAKLFDRMRRLLHSTSLLSILIGTTVLAVVANFYELLCTAGFPMVFTRILTLNNLSTTGYYLYLVLYNLVYVVPLSVIVLGFTFTLGRRKLTEWQGRVLKLVSGSMMLGLGGILLFNPALLNSVKVSFLIMLSAVAVSLLVVALMSRGRHAG